MAVRAANLDWTNRKKPITTRISHSDAGEWWKMGKGDHGPSFCEKFIVQKESVEQDQERSDLARMKRHRGRGTGC